MAARSRIINTSPERVFAVLADGWSYASWVVGASHIRDVDAGWPSLGARIHHQVGPWPLHIKDVTSVEAVVPGRMLELHARAWPLGAATVRLDLEPVDSATRATLSYELTAGAGRFLPRPLQSILLGPRSTEILGRLADIAVRRELKPTAAPRATG
ncbi:SRPBCC family protein [Phytohabitans sp. ZYX-F-186]|uniref:SRPBCC family protein n=1 Tax=Phytohabitans maris TaxID=3071409 RepID=A0ABU0ZET9_9ACTN|nr:SRPBCC family protein [Phytohabitans sp. ZYX-F-186]MDQ7905569.1 SRPBCC family protein [Phytohabitans sp. ZYX-F-186]